MVIQILTLFPEMFTGVLQSSILKRAQEQKLVEFRLINFRDYSNDKHRTVDDTPYGGGAGMVLKPEPIFKCLQSVKNDIPDAKVVLLSPQGMIFRQEIAKKLAREENIILICGHYEGFDERIRSFVDVELSIGDYILTGGEIAALVVCDAITRLIPGVLGSEDSAVNDSFSNNLLDYPQYTRPPVFEGMAVPDVLLSGHHAMIEKWRREQSILRTAIRRPDLLQTAPLTDDEKKFLEKDFNLKL